MTVNVVVSGAVWKGKEKEKKVRKEKEKKKKASDVVSSLVPISVPNTPFSTGRTKCGVF